MPTTAECVISIEPFMSVWHVLRADRMKTPFASSVHTLTAVTEFRLDKSGAALHVAMFGIDIRYYSLHARIERGQTESSGLPFGSGLGRYILCPDHLPADACHVCR